MTTQAPPKVYPMPVSIKMTVQQRATFDKLRHKQHLTRTQLLEAALIAYCATHNVAWPAATRRDV